jgi:hypothetical protein
VRGFDRDLRRAKGIMASGTWKGRIKGRTHDRTDQHCAETQKSSCQRRGCPHTTLRVDLKAGRRERRARHSVSEAEMEGKAVSGPSGGFLRVPAFDG